MTPCARGCCWTPTICARNRTCPCHWGESPRTEPRTSDARTHSDPTANEAIRRAMKSGQKPRDYQHKERR